MTVMTAAASLTSGGRRYRIVDLRDAAGADLGRLPFIHRILLENVLRTAGGDVPRAAAAILAWLRTGSSGEEIPFLPGRVLMHDTTCGPALVDIAGMRSALAEAGGNPRRLNPVLPVDVSTDHSLAVDVFGAPDAMRRNMGREFGRNAERGILPVAVVSGNRNFSGRVPSQLAAGFRACHVVERGRDEGHFRRAQAVTPAALRHAANASARNSRCVRAVLR